MKKPHLTLRGALREYGWLLAVVVSLASATFAWQVANPVEETHDIVASVVTDSSGRCPGGWEPNDQRNADFFLYTCSRLVDGEAYIVSLDGQWQCSAWVNLDTGVMGTGCEGEQWWSGP